MAEDDEASILKVIYMLLLFLIVASCSTSKDNKIGMKKYNRNAVSDPNSKA